MDAQTPNAETRVWWTAKKGDAHKSVSSLVQFLWRHQKERRRANNLHMRIVSSDDPAGRGLADSQMDRAVSKLQGAVERSRNMLCLSIVDTACSIIASSKPTIQYLTNGGKWSDQQKAKKRTMALAGQMRKLGIERLGPRAVRNACIWDIGVVHAYVHPVTNEVCAELVIANELMVDHNEALHGDPTTIYWTSPVNRHVLTDLYPKKAREIKAASAVGFDDRTDFMLTRESAAESVLVYRAWRKSVAGRPGRFVMCVEGATLADEEYPHTEFPFAVFKYSELQLGWYGQSLVCRTKESQRRLNRLAKFVDRCQDLMSRPVIFLPKSAGLSPEHINNLPAQVIPTEDGKPEYAMWVGTPPDLEVAADKIRERALQDEGFSEQQIAGEMMPGVRSGVGIRAADDYQSRRHIHPTRRYEGFHVDFANLLARCNDEAAARDPDYTVTARAKRGRREYLNHTRWLDVAIDPKDATIDVFPTSSLSTTPKGRRDDVVAMLQAQLISQEQAIELLDLPDIDADTANMLAEVDYTRWMVECIAEGTKDPREPVDPILGVNGMQLCLDTCRKTYLQASYNEADEEVLDRLREFMTSLKEGIERLTPPAPPAPTQDDPSAQMAQMGAPAGQPTMGVTA